MGNKAKLFLLLIAAFAAAGCSSPWGSINGRAIGTEAYDGIKAVGRETYYLGELFQPQRTADLTVYKTNNGQRLQSTVPINECEISVRDDGVLYPVPYGNNHPFSTVGTKTIVVRHRGYEDQFDVVVLEPDPGTYPTGPNGNNNEEPGIIIEWPDG